jgi:hypothetical protein
MRTLRTCSVRRYRVAGKVPDPRSGEFVRRLKDRRFLPLKANEERTYGWVSADNLLVTEFDPDQYVYGSRAVLAFRVDRRRVNARLLRAQLELEVRARGKAAGRVSREERQQLRRDLHAELLRNTSPALESHTVIYNAGEGAYDAEAGTLAALTLSRPANEVLRVLFQDTFGADLVPSTPWRRGAELLAGSLEAGVFETLERSTFAPVAAAAPVPVRSAP